jgi:CBS domain-containing protein
MLVRDVMTAKAEFISPDTTVHQAANKMRELDVGFLPIGENDRLVGMLTDRDITLRTVAEGKDPDATTVADIMTRRVEYCYDDQDVKQAGEHMKTDRIRRLVVLDHDKRLVGVCSLGDIALKGTGHELAGDVLHGVSRSDRKK